MRARRRPRRASHPSEAQVTSCCSAPRLAAQARSPLHRQRTAAKGRTMAAESSTTAATGNRQQRAEAGQQTCRMRMLISTPRTPDAVFPASRDVRAGQARTSRYQGVVTSRSSRSTSASIKCSAAKSAASRSESAGAIAGSCARSLSTWACCRAATGHACGPALHAGQIDEFRHGRSVRLAAGGRRRGRSHRP